MRKYIAWLLLFLLFLFSYFVSILSTNQFDVTSFWTVLVLFNIWGSIINNERHL